MYKGRIKKEDILFNPDNHMLTVRELH